METVIVLLFLILALGGGWWVQQVMARRRRQQEEAPPPLPVKAHAQEAERRKAIKAFLSSEAALSKTLAELGLRNDAQHDLLPLFEPLQHRHETIIAAGIALVHSADWEAQIWLRYARECEALQREYLEIAAQHPESFPKEMSDVRPTFKKESSKEEDCDPS